MEGTLTEEEAQELIDQFVIAETGAIFENPRVQ